MFGGDTVTGIYQDDLWSFDGCIWKRESDVPFKNRVLHSSGVLNGRLWVYGGQRVDYGGHSFNDVSLYTDAWSTDDMENWTSHNITAGVLPRSAIIGDITFNGQIVLLGGGIYPVHDYVRETNSEVLVSDNGIDFYRISDAPWEKRMYHSVIEYKGYVFVIGGYNEDKGNLDDIWYTADIIHWYRIETPPSFIARHAVTAWVEGDVLRIGFGSASNPLNDVWELRID
jgi:hypothetical protein